MQNNAARIVLQEPKRSHATPLLRKLHWLPVQQRIVYKVAVLTFKIRSTSMTSYLRRLISDQDHVHNLRSATTSLSQSSSRTTLAKHAFRCSAPSVWNSLPRTVVDSDSIAVFKSKDISLLSGLLSFLFSLPLAHYLAQCLWSYDHMALYKCLYYYYYYGIGEPLEMALIHLRYHLLCTLVSGSKKDQTQ